MKIIDASRINSKLYFYFAGEKVERIMPQQPQMIRDDSFHDAEDVRRLADVLARIPLEDVQRKLRDDPERFRPREIEWIEDFPDVLSFQAVCWRRLVEFFQAAVRENQAMIVNVL